MGRVRWPGLLVTGCLAVGTAGTAVPAAETITVGLFLVELTRARGLPASDVAAAESSLRSAGVALPPLDLDRPLTEGDVAAISRALGLRVATSRPSAPFTREQVGAFVLAFGPELAAASGRAGQPREDPGASSGKGTTNPDPQPGKGKSKGHNKSPSEPI